MKILTKGKSRGTTLRGLFLGAKQLIDDDDSSLIIYSICSSVKKRMIETKCNYCRGENRIRTERRFLFLGGV